jgi:serine/threonine-protein kinase RsbW
MKKKIKLQNSLSELDLLNKELKKIAGLWKLPQIIIFQINLVLDELFTNTVSYGYSDDSVHEVLITIDYKSDRILLTMVDDGMAFNPAEKRNYDTTLPPAQREPGGLGILLVQKYIDELSYTRRDGKNITTLIKRVDKDNDS